MFEKPCRYQETGNGFCPASEAGKRICTSAIDYNIAEESCKDFTYKGSNGTNSLSRIDRIYVKKRVYERAEQWTIHPTRGDFDHDLVAFKYSHRAEVERGKASWRLNTSLMPTKGYKAGMAEIIAKHAEKCMHGWEEMNEVDSKGHITDRWFMEIRGNNPEITVSYWDELMTAVTAYAKEFQDSKASTKRIKERKLKESLKRAKANDLQEKENAES